MNRIEKFKTGNSFSSLYSLTFNGRYLAVDTSPFVRVKLLKEDLEKGASPKDFVGRAIRDKAFEFNHIHSATLDPLPQKRDPSYLLFLFVQWEASHFQLTISEISKGRVVLSSPNINPNAIIINCKPNPLEPKDSDSFWEGYKAENNFLDMVRKQIDDRNDPLSGIYVNPSGGLTIDYMNGGITKSRILSGSIIAAIVYSVPALYISFEGYYRHLLNNMLSRSR